MKLNLFGMIKMIKLFISVLLISSLSWAECSKPVTYLKESQPAICSGYLFTEEKELEVRTKVLQYDTLDKLVKKQDELIDNLTQRVDLTSKQNIVLYNELQSRSDREWYINIAFFLGGSLITAYIASNVNR